jgi:hypothetical protein
MMVVQEGEIKHGNKEPRVCREILLLARNNWLQKRIGLPLLLFMYDG